MSPRPHPILKRDMSPFRTPTLPFSNCGPLFSPHVHFPPTPRIAATYPADSPTTYDRAPITVSPNICALPRRGERTIYTPSADLEGERRGRSRHRARGCGGSGENIKGSYFHPRAYEACKPEPLNVPTAPFDLPSTPPLDQDLSPSDESDETVTTPPDLNSSESIPHSIPLHFEGVSSTRCPAAVDKADFGSPPPVARSAPRRKARRPNLRRTEKQLEYRSSSFSPDLDEGCLGGF
ncbi:hypothetical protein BN946_scf185013.g30 [Trametes cinnabarina]|uniref:Uncharacterized protein n=1 Tax=Pycnoporus cinnabarinus TaxID=5643 RepID=A0A060SGU4_PYCCI|nr:hypothetical protein BN946_scf185013.g30 [Trametes cinnabarina]